MLALLRERNLLLDHDVHVTKQVGALGGGEHTFWLCAVDAHVLLLLAFAGRKRANDRGVQSFLKQIGGMLRDQHILERSLRTSTG